MTAQWTGSDDARLTWEEFLHFQQAYRGDERFAWEEGLVVTVMTGGTERHDLTVMALVGQLRAALSGGPCRVFAHNRQVKTRRRSYYPDVVVRCGRATDPLFEDDARLIVEVLSPSNMPAERTRMLFDYQELPSIEVVVFVDTRRRVVTVHEKTPEGWTERTTKDGRLENGLITLNFAEMWAEVDAASSFD